MPDQPQSPSYGVRHSPKSKRPTPPAPYGFWRWLPDLFTLRHYQVAWLPRDILASLALTAVLVVAAEPVTCMDITSVNMLTELDDSPQKAGIELVFAEMKDPVKDKLKRC